MEFRGVLYGFVICFIIHSAQCQGGMGGMGGMAGVMNMMTRIPNMINNMMETRARTALDRSVKFIVGQTATPSPEMITFGVVAGGSPTTQAERDAYLDMMKRVARKTPETVQKFLKTENVNGTQRTTLDEVQLDAYITTQALKYGAASKAKRLRKEKEEQQLRQRELEVIRMRQMHELNMMTMMASGHGGPGNGMPANPMSPTQRPTMDAFVMDSTTFYGNRNNIGLRPHDTPTGILANLSPASDGTISLIDIYKMLDQRVNAAPKQAIPPGNNAPVVPAAPQTGNPAAGNAATMFESLAV